jgi:hypothetical protein
LGEWVAPRERTAGGGSSCIYQTAVFSNGRFWLCHVKIVRAQNKQMVFKNETQERGKEKGEQNFSKLAIAR